MYDLRFSELGFSGFVHLDPRKRDGFIRKVWVGLYNDNIITFSIKIVDDHWELERIDCDVIDDNLADLISDKSNIDRLLNFICNIQ